MVRTRLISGNTDNKAPDIKDSLAWYAERSVLEPVKAEVMRVEGFRASFGKLD